MSHEAKAGPAYVTDIRLLIQGISDKEPSLSLAEVKDFLSETLRNTKGIADWSYVHYERTAPQRVQVPEKYEEGDLHALAIKAGLEDTSNEDVEWCVFAHLRERPNCRAIAYVHAKSDFEAAGIVAWAWKPRDWDSDAWEVDGKPTPVFLTEKDRVVIDNVQRVETEPPDVAVEMLERLEEVLRGLKDRRFSPESLRAIEETIGKAKRAGIRSKAREAQASRR